MSYWQNSRLRFESVARLLVPLSLLLLAGFSPLSGQNSSGSGSQIETKTFVSENGTQTVSRTVETVRTQTNDGEIEVQRYREPVYAGDNRVSWEREVRTRKLPDGTVEKETTFRNPDGANRLQPTRVIREKITGAADDTTTTTQREVLKFDLDGQPQPIERETVTETAAGNSKQSISVVQRPNASHEWQTVERRNTVTRSSADGTVTNSERQLPDASGQLADYERIEQRSSGQPGSEAREVTVSRRDLSDTASRQFLLVEHTKESTATEAGNTVRHIVTESDFLYGVAARTERPEVVEDRTERTTVAPDGSRQLVVTIKAREPADPAALRPVTTLVRQTDAKGYVREIFLPSQ